ncbi:hypothetical protein [Flavisphingomonas formosensis]|uniref:hypothetical protein n=1 Tax=Flavisphingomonas formosensis TaxID=861534 RepID=UPI002FCD3050
MKSPPLVASLELGGTKCIASLASGRHIRRTERVATGDQPERTLSALLDILGRWHADTPFAAIGIASFGPLGLHPDRADFGRILKTPKPGCRRPTSWARFVRGSTCLWGSIPMSALRRWRKGFGAPRSVAAPTLI